ncbi:MAG TPA: conjugative transposon protein TraM [Puia sp.]|nr:conjugative transposon protein TraM [Puia sp.]
MEKINNELFLRKRKMMVMLPIFILPSIVILFIALGGGKASAAAKQAVDGGGINAELPNAQFRKTKPKDKLELYEESRKASLKMREQEPRKTNAYSNDEWLQSDSIENRTPAIRDLSNHYGSPYKPRGIVGVLLPAGRASATDSNALAAKRKLAQLQKIVQGNSSGSGRENLGTSVNADQASIRPMQRRLYEKDPDPDPETAQLNNMLDKVMLIQHPEKMQDSMQRLAEKNKVRTLEVKAREGESYLSLMDTMDEHVTEAGAFYGLNDGGGGESKAQVENAISAAIPESQTLVSGATVKIRLMQDIVVSGVTIPADECIYGIASLSNERLRISINSLRVGARILPVSMSVYDLDGIEGIYIPGSINRDVSKQSADEAVSAIGLTTLDPSLGAQAATAGIQAAKTLASRKIRLVRVTIPSGYRVLLRDNHLKN